MNAHGTLLLVHGSWHGPWCWDGVIAALGADGSRVVAAELPMTSLHDDVDTLRDAIREAKRSGPVTVVGHSYAGAVLNCGAHEADHLGYVAAIVPDANQSVQDAFGASIGDAPGVEVRDGATRLTAEGLPLLYGTCEGAARDQLLTRLRPLSLSCESESLDVAPAWQSVPSTYIVCANDQLLPPDYQRQRAALMAATVELAADHSPFVSTPEQTAHLFAELAGWR